VNIYRKVGHVLPDACPPLRPAINPPDFEGLQGAGQPAGDCGQPLTSVQELSAPVQYIRTGFLETNGPGASDSDEDEEENGGGEGYTSQHAAKAKEQHRAATAVLRPSTYFPSREQEFYALAFPELFPYGHGGHNEPGRRVPISEAVWVAAMLQRHNRAFQRHTTFSLVAFDRIARAHALSSIKYRATLLAQADLEQVAYVTEDQIRLYLAYKKQCRTAAANHSQRPALPKDLRGAEVLLQQVTRTTECWYGSDGERQVNQRNVWSMQSRLGRPTLFFTINLYEGNMYHIVINCGLAENVNLDAADPQLIPQHTLVQYAFDFPAAYAQTFHDNIELFFAHIVGFDKDRNGPVVGGGLFGVPKAYTACVESNGRYTLHLHAMLTLFGFYRTQTEQDKLLRDPTFQDRFKKHVDSVVCAFIGEADFAQTPCSMCNVPNTMIAQDLPADAATGSSTNHPLACAAVKTIAWPPTILKNGGRHFCTCFAVGIPILFFPPTPMYFCRHVVLGQRPGLALRFCKTPSRRKNGCWLCTESCCCRINWPCTSGGITTRASKRAGVAACVIRKSWWSCLKRQA
jgi:hypothetical protein